MKPGNWPAVLAAAVKPYDGLVVSITDATPSGSGSGPTGSGVVTSNITTVSVTSGGTGTYSYSWYSIVTWTNGPFALEPSKTANAVAFQDFVPDIGEPVTETWRCSVYDVGNGKTGSTGAIVSLQWTDTGGS